MNKFGCLLVPEYIVASDRILVPLVIVPQKLLVSHLDNYSKETQDKLAANDNEALLSSIIELSKILRSLEIS